MTEARKRIDLAALQGFCSPEPDLEAGSWKLTFVFDRAVTTIRVVFDDFQTGADMVITNMTTLPDTETGKGWGRRALADLLIWADRCDLRDIRAVQVQPLAEAFWEKSGFVAEKNSTNDFRLSRPAPIVQPSL